MSRATTCRASTRLTQAERTRLTRTRLRESAEQAFAEKGIAGTAVEEIARGAGYSKGAFYGNYPDKTSLLMDLLEEKQLGEVRYWQAVMETARDPETDLDLLSHRYDDLEYTRQRTLLSTELQMESDRNPEFGAIFKGYMDQLYEEIARAIDAILERHGKARPADFDTIVVTIRLLGLGLGSGAILGNTLAARTTPGQIMLSYIRGFIAAAPDRT
jgi:AcrR family transcriptional regulator